MPCPLCRTRRAKRQCPALGRSICAVCCATSRLVEVSCPPTCGYLAAAESHPPAVVRRQQERDLALLMPAVSGLSDQQSGLLSLVFSVLAGHGADALVAPRDVDVLDGVSALLATYETARRGVIYEHRPATLPGQRIMGELTVLFADAARQAGRPVDGDAVLALERVKQLGDSVRKTSPESDRALIALLRRVSSASSASERGRSAGGGSLVVP
jgi:hypothetical protein